MNSGRAELGDLAVVLAAHGDRGGPHPNRTLASVAEQLKRTGRFRDVTWGVLNGERTVEQALQTVAAARQVAVVPMFMSDGYFVEGVLPQRVKDADVGAPVTILPPLGLHPDLPELILRRALDAAHKAEFDLLRSGLLVVGHGSKYGRASADATRRVADAIRERDGFARVDVAFLEEAPFLRSELLSPRPPRIVAGFFFSPGMHGADDVPIAIEETGARAIYTWPVGTYPEIPTFVLTLIEARFSHHIAT